MEAKQRVGALTEIPQLLRELGRDPAPVAAEAGVDIAVLRNPENALAFPEMGRLFQACVAATGCQHFGLLLGQRSATASLGLVGRLMRNAPSFGDAILDLCVNQPRYVRGSVVYLVVQDQTAYWGYAVHHPEMPAIEQVADAVIAIGSNMMRELAGASPDEILACRHLPRDVAPYRRGLGMTPRFDADQNALAFPASLLARPVSGADPALRSILQKAVAEYWAVRQPSVEDQVVRVLRARVMFPDASLSDVAAQLAMHPRTLNRRLQSSGTSFRRLRDQSRLEAARQLLAGTRMEVTNIGLALGYADPSGFTHAFRRWTGASPSEWRGRSGTDREPG